MDSLKTAKMDSLQITNHQLLHLVRVYWNWRPVWIGTTSVFAFLALFYAVFLKSDVWVASQGLIIRDEASGAVMRLGRFQSQTEMKAAQETILEMAHNSQVLSDALLAVGRPPRWFAWSREQVPPTVSEIEDLARSGIEVRAPRGAELGTTEVIYLDVKQNSPIRAVELNKAVCNALENRMREVRRIRADGVIAELQTARDTAELKLSSTTRQLKEMEAEAGADLSDLRSLTDATVGNSSNRVMLDTIKAELRSAELVLQEVKSDWKLALESYENPDQLLLTPSSLVNSQAGLKTLRDGLAAATINTSQLQGLYKSSHPLVVASLQAETRIREQLRGELGLAVQSLGKEVEIADERVRKLVSQEALLESRLESIARVRADYANVASEVRARSLQLQEAQRELGLAQASRDAAMTSSLITRLDQPQLGEKPLGPGRGTVVVGAAVSGLFFGLGIIFLLTPLDGTATQTSNFTCRSVGYETAPENPRGRRAGDLVDREVPGFQGCAAQSEQSLAGKTDPINQSTPLTHRVVDRNIASAVGLPHNAFETVERAAKASASALKSMLDSSLSRRNPGANTALADTQLGIQAAVAAATSMNLESSPIRVPDAIAYFDRLNHNELGPNAAPSSAEQAVAATLLDRRSQTQSRESARQATDSKAVVANVSLPPVPFSQHAATISSPQV